MVRPPATVAHAKLMKTSWLWLLAEIASVALLAGCTTKRCAELKYHEKDGTVSSVKKCFDIYTSSKTEIGFTNDAVKPSAEQRRFEWMAEQKKEGIQSITFSNEL